VRNHATFRVEGEPHTTVHILVNDAEYSQVTLPEEGSADVTIDLSEFEDGGLVLHAYSVNNANGRSDLSEPLTVTKHTQGPSLSLEHLSFIISPAFDTGKAALLLPPGDYEQLYASHPQHGELASHAHMIVLPSISAIAVHAVDDLGNVTILEDITIAPQFGTHAYTDNLRAPSRLTQFSRRITAIVAAILILLLLLAVFVRVRIQHPALITHASLVILLAIMLFLL
jgi:hypothetical protein